MKIRKFAISLQHQGWECFSGMHDRWSSLSSMHRDLMLCRLWQTASLLFPEQIKTKSLSWNQYQNQGQTFIQRFNQIRRHHTEICINKLLLLTPEGVSKFISQIGVPEFWISWFSDWRYSQTDMLAFRAQTLSQFKLFQFTCQF